MRWLLGAIALLASFAAHAQDCLPSGPWAPIDKIGGVLMEGRDNTIKGDWRAVWCPTGTFGGPNGTEIWRLNVHATLDKYKTATPESIKAGALAVYSASDPVAALKAIMKAGEFIPPAGTKDRFDWESLLYVGCVQGRALPPPGVNGPILKDCQPPTPLPTAEVWRTPSAGTFTVFTTVSGKLSGIVAGVKALPNEICMCADVSVLSGTSRYCTTASIQPNRVTYCVKAK